MSTDSNTSGTPRNPALPPLGPAVSHPTDSPAAGARAMEAPLPPFAGPRAAGSPADAAMTSPPPPVEAAEADPRAVDSGVRQPAGGAGLGWLDAIDWEDSPAAPVADFEAELAEPASTPPATPWVGAAITEAPPPADLVPGELPPWMAWVEDPAHHEEPAEPADDLPIYEVAELGYDEPAPEPPAAGPDAEWIDDTAPKTVQAQEPEQARAAEPAATTGALPAAEPSLAALGEVADRLERIAARLRASPADLFAPSADPLEQLLTGFVLGYLSRDGATKSSGKP